MCSTPFGIRDSTQWAKETALRQSQSAQRLSASEIRHMCAAVTDTLIVLRCSTPFGIRDSTHPIFNMYLHESNSCSTPFGIRDSTLSMCARFASFSACAQRLSASEIRHLIKQSLEIVIIKCSTPFGIRDSTPLLVLLVHETCLCAQRLSASEIRHQS